VLTDSLSGYNKGNTGGSANVHRIDPEAKADDQPTRTITLITLRDQYSFDPAKLYPNWQAAAEARSEAAAEASKEKREAKAEAKAAAKAKAAA